MSRLEKYRSTRRAELLAAVQEAKRVLLRAEQSLGAEYRKAFATLLRAGARYDSARNAERDPAFEDLSLWFAEPDDVMGSVDESVKAAVEALDGILKELR